MPFAALIVALTQVVVHGDQALRGVPPQLMGVNLTSYSKAGTGAADWVPCCTGTAAILPQPVALWRTPGGILGDFFHINGLYDDDNLGAAANGVTMVRFIALADQLHGGLLHILNINASDQELVNELEYLNSPLPASPDPSWTKTSFRYDAQAPDGYFAWLRGQDGHPAPAGVKYVEIGNEVWNFFNDTDRRCNHDSTCYGVQAAALTKKLKAKDPLLQVGVSILTEGQSANAKYRAPDIYAGFNAAGIAPDFVFDHGYYNCNYGKEDAAEASASAAFGDNLATAAATNRAELTAAFPSCGNQIGMFFDEFGPQACAGNADRWEAFGPWETAAAAWVYASGLHSGYSHVSYYDWNDGADTGQDGLVFGEPGVVDANFWGVWFASKLVAGASAEVAVDGMPAGLRAVATTSDGTARMLVVNTSATDAQSLSVSLAGRSASASRVYRMDQSYATLSSVPAHRAGVPQAPPAGVAADLSSLAIAPLSTTLVEWDLTAGAAPSATPAASGCADPKAGATPSSGTSGCSCSGASAGSLVAAGLLFAMGFRALRRSSLGRSA
jgi:hypothetical protein